MPPAMLLPPHRFYSPPPRPPTLPIGGPSFSFPPIFKLYSSFSPGLFNHDESLKFNLDLDRMLTVLTEDTRRMLAEHQEFGDLTEVVIDLGRKPLARFPSGDFVLSDRPVTVEDIQHALSQVGDFAVDNRAGISRTLHRISAIRNRKGKIIGLTCRVGRALPGSANSLRDLIEGGASLLLIGPPGVGKTTILRDIARMLADDFKKRVMIVDTSNEIGGDGDIPHAGIGSARRMQVPHADEQHKVLIEAVENHMPQVVVIDEIGTKLEATAASTIAQRGIQLVATAHGVTIKNLVVNPALEMLVGGVQSVTLGDEEASRRRVQKTVLERKGPSPFSCGVEIITKTEVRVHRHLEATVDAILQGRRPNFDIRRLYQQPVDELEPESLQYELSESTIGSAVDEDTFEMEDGTSTTNHVESISEEKLLKDENALCIFLYGISEASVTQGMKQLKIDEPIEFTDNISEADVLLALQSKVKKNSQLEAAARSRGIPTYVSKTNASAQIRKTIQALMSDYADGFESYECKVKVNEAEKIDALEEARIAIEQTVIPKREPANLLPRASNILLLQKDLIRKYNLQTERVVSELGLQHLRILPLKSMANEDSTEFEYAEDDGNFENFNGLNNENEDASFAVNKLPLLPD